MVCCRFSPEEEKKPLEEANAAEEEKQPKEAGKVLCCRLSPEEEKKPLEEGKAAEEEKQPKEAGKLQAGKAEDQAFVAAGRKKMKLPS